jgi:hypothetical protein
MSERTVRLLLPLLAGSLISLGYATVVAGSRPGHEWPAWLLVSAGCVLGVCGCAGAGFGWIVYPMLCAARTCDRVAAGDLSQTLQEVGPRPLRVVARVFNTILADFQEVLLLFAYSLRSAKTSIQLLREQADRPGGSNAIRSLCASTLDDLRQMQEMIEGFRYFRVRIESGSVTDAGVRPAGRSDGMSGAGARPCDSARNPDGSVVKREGSDHE